jgi:hypothetical protein
VEKVLAGLLLSFLLESLLAGLLLSFLPESLLAGLLLLLLLDSLLAGLLLLLLLESLLAGLLLSFLPESLLAGLLLSFLLDSLLADLLVLLLPLLFLFFFFLSTSLAGMNLLHLLLAHHLPPSFTVSMPRTIEEAPLHLHLTVSKLGHFSFLPCSLRRPVGSFHHDVADSKRHKRSIVNRRDEPFVLVPVLAIEARVSTVLLFELGFVLLEKADDFCVSAVFVVLNSALSWCFTADVLLERVELKADQEPHEGRTVVNSCKMKSCFSYFVLQKRVGAVLDKELGDLQVAVVTSPEESGVSMSIFPVDDRLVSADEPLHFGKVASFYGVFESFS